MLQRAAPALVAVLAVVGIAALTLPGCIFSADWDGTSYRCASGECPPGQRCVDGRCVDGDAPDAAPPDAAPPDAAPDATADAAPPPNLLVNPGLEEENTQWSAYRGEVAMTTSAPHGGERALVACKRDDGATSLYTAWYDFVNGNGALPRGARFRATAWVRAGDEERRAPPALALVVRESGGEAPRQDHMGPALSDVTEEWTQIHVEAEVTQPDRTQLVLLLWPGDVPDGTCFKFDDVSAVRLE